MAPLIGDTDMKAILARLGALREGDPISPQLVKDLSQATLTMARIAEEAQRERDEQATTLVEERDGYRSDRDNWIRLFNRLEKACGDAIDRNPDDDALAAAHRAVMKEAGSR